MPTFPEDPIASYPMGQRVTMFVDFTDAAGDPADPDVVVLRYLEGDLAGTRVDVLQVGLDNPSVGRWELGIVAPLDGDKAVKPWAYRFEGSSADPLGVNAADEKRFEIDPSPIYPPS